MSESDFDFDANEERLSNEGGSSVNAENEEDVTMDDVDEYLDEGEAYMEEDVDIDDLEDETEEEDEEEQVEQKEEVEETKEEESEDGDPYSKIREDILKVVDEDTILKIKDKELRVGDLSKDELVMHLQKGIRANDLFQEAAETRRQLEQERALVTKGAQAVQQLLSQQEQGKTRTSASLDNFLDKLKVDEYDTENEKSLKLIAAEMAKELDTLKRDVHDSKKATYEGAVVNEIKTLKKQYPLASVDEVLAVKTSRPDASLDRLMEAGHNYYSSLEFIDEALKANPQAKRELEERVIRDYNAKKGKAKKVPLKQSRTSGSKKVSERSRPKMGFGYGFDDAEAYGKDYLKEVARIRG
jgi:hypothetical protein